MTNPIKNKSKIIAWCLYDWAGSAFPVVIMTFVFATYFTQAIAKNSVIGTWQWGNMIAISGVIVALLSPILGAMADYLGRRKLWLMILTYITIIASALLWFAKPSIDSVQWALFWVAVGTISYELASIFYNAMLRLIAPSTYIGRISGWGWGVGYFGGLICLAIALLVFVQASHPLFSLNRSLDEHIRIIGPLVAVWFLLFSLPLFLCLHDPLKPKASLKHAIVESSKVYWRTLKQLRQYKNVMIFLLAHMIYVDALNTVFAFGGIYAAGTIGMNMTEVIQFGIAINITAGLGAASFAWLDDYLGAKPTIIFSLICMIVLALALLIVHSKILFWIFALALGIFIGPVQAASRSLMARLAPTAMINEMFGLYSFSGRLTAFIGPWLFGFLTDFFVTQRAGMVSVVAFLIFGLVLLFWVVEPSM